MGFYRKILRRYAAIVLIVLIAFAAISDTGHRIAASAFAPVVSIGSDLIRLFGNGLRLILPGTAGKEPRFDKLTAENLTLRAQLADDRLQLRNYNQLRQSAGLPLPPQWKAVPAEIISIQPARWNEIMTINRGNADGVVQGSAVLLSNGAMVGRVLSADRHTAVICTLLAPECQFGVLLTGSDGKEYSGVMAGTGAAEYMNSGLSSTVDFLPRHLSVPVGTRVLTSALGGNMPYGIDVGTTATPIHIEGALRGKVSCRPSAEFGLFTLVFVITAQ